MPVNRHSVSIYSEAALRQGGMRSSENKLEIIEERERTAKEHYSEMLDQHQAKAMSIVKDVFIGFLTAGMYFVPKVIRQFKSDLKEKEQIPSETIQEVFDYIEINDVAINKEIK